MKATLIKLTITALLLWGAASWLGGVTDSVVDLESSANDARIERLDAAYSGGVR